MVPEPPRFPSRKETFNYDQYKMAATIYRHDVMAYIRDLEHYKATPRLAPRHNSPQDDQDLSDVSSSLSRSGGERTVTMSIPGRFPESEKKPSSSPVLHYLDGHYVNPMRSLRQAEVASSPRNIPLLPSPVTSYTPPPPGPSSTVQNTEVALSKPAQVHGPQSPSYHSEEEDQGPTDEAPTDVEEIPRSLDRTPPPKFANDTIYVMDAIETNMGHTMVPLYEGFQGEQQFYRKTTDGDYEHIMGPNFPAWTISAPTKNPEVSLYIIENGSMRMHQPGLDDWDMDLWFKRGDGRYQQFRLPGSKEPVRVIDKPHQPYPFRTRNITPPIPSVIYLDDAVIPNLQPPLVPTKVVPVKRIAFGNTTTYATDATEVPVLGVPKNDKEGMKAAPQRKLPAPPSTPVLPPLSQPQARRPVILEDVPEESDEEDARPYVGPPANQSTPRKDRVKRMPSMRDIPEDPSHQAPPHLSQAGFKNQEADFVKRNTTLGFTRRSKLNQEYKPGIEPSSFTTVEPLPPSPAPSARTPNLGPAPKPQNVQANVVTLDQGPSLHATQTKAHIWPDNKKKEELPATLIPTNKDEMIQVPFTQRRQSALPKFIQELAHTNTAMRDLITTQRRRKSLNEQVARYTTNGAPGDPYDSDGSSSEDDKGKQPPKEPPGQPPRRNPDQADQTNSSTANARQAQAFRGPAPPHFDTKLKLSDTVPTWDGNKETLADWITVINELAERSDYTYVQLGELVPLRFEADAKEWWYSHDAAWRLPKTRNWDTLKDAVLTHFMNRTWMERQANKAQYRAYRDSLHPQETPSQYIRDKKKMLQHTHEYQSEGQLIFAVLEKAPREWGRIFDTSVIVLKITVVGLL
ncbi:hypothetical protein RSAG8_04147, partial [Rhizoctonia solani AG-8 WAC10335]